MVCSGGVLISYWLTLGVSSSVFALLSDNNPNHFSPMLSPPARSGRYPTSAVFALFLAFTSYWVLFLSLFFIFVFTL